MTKEIPNLKLEQMNLILCCPFSPNKITNNLPFSYYFIDPGTLNYPIIRLVAGNYSHVLMEPEIAGRFNDNKEALPSNARIMDSSIKKEHGGKAPPRILFLASNDTHAHFMMRIGEKFENVLFVIPKLRCKDEGADRRLTEQGKV